MSRPPFAETAGLLSIHVLVDGVALADDVQLSGLQIEHELRRTGRALLEVIDGGDVRQKSAVSESSAFEPGNTIEIRLGHGEIVRSVFSGIVLKQGLRMEHAQPMKLRVVCTSAMETVAADGTDCGLVVTFGESMFTLDIETATEALGRVSGSVGCPGTALPRPGNSMTLCGLGARFDGSAFIRRVVHCVDEGNWTTTVDVGRLASSESVLMSDENGNRISFSAAGISITSPADIRIEASTDVSVRGAMVMIN